MLEAGIRRVRGRRRQGEVVVQVARAEVLRCLRDDLRALHGLAVPERGPVL